MTAHPSSDEIDVHGQLWLTAKGLSIGGPGRMALLQAVAHHGSITHAARAVGMSYKAAWDALDLMNQRAGQPLVDRTTGGRGGGATRLTPHGERLVQRFVQVQRAHALFVERLGEGAFDLSVPFSLLEVVPMKTSARNQMLGEVAVIRAGAVNDEVEVALDGGGRLVCVLSRQSVADMGLAPRQRVLSLVQAGDVMLATGAQDVRVSARNQWSGRVSRVVPGAVNTEVVMDLDGGGELVALVTQASAQRLELAPGCQTRAWVKASDVLLAVAG